MTRIKRRLLPFIAAAALSLGMAMPAAAAVGPIVVGPGGLVNVVLVDTVDITDVTIQVPVSVAANICDVNAAVLIAAIEDTGSATCEAGSDSRANNN